MPVCTESGRQMSPRIVTDGAGGAIITWEDERGGNVDIYAQRIGPYGQVLWDTGGVAVCAGNGRQYAHNTVSDGAGGAIIAWRDERNDPYTGIYMQRMDGSGGPVWEEGGTAVCPVLASQYRFGLVTDGAGGAIVMWEDARDGFRKAYAQKIDSCGNRQWTHEGVKVTDVALGSLFPDVLPDNDGGAVIVWVRARSDGWTMYAQDIAADGSFGWSGDVEVGGGTRVIEGYSSASDGGGGAVIAWDEVSMDRPYHRISAQRIDEGGVVGWSAGGVPLYDSAEQCRKPRVAQADDGSAIIVWEATDGSTFWQYAQRIDSGGFKIWDESGVEVCYTASTQYSLSIIPDGGGIISVWSEKRDPAQHDLIAQRLTPGGDFQWTVTGLRVCSAGGDQVSPGLVPDGEGGAIIAWQDGRDLHDSYIYALRIGPDGGLPPVTKLENHTAYGSGYDIVVLWTLSQAGRDMAFSVFRAVEPGGAFEEIIDPELSGSTLTFAFIDRGLEPSSTYRYRVDVSDDEGVRILFETGPVTTAPMPLTLYQNFPNPFNPHTTIYFYLPEAAWVILDIHDASGRRVFKLLDGRRGMGHHGEGWDGCDAGGNPLPSGVYFCRLRSCLGSGECKMVLVR